MIEIKISQSHTNLAVRAAKRIISKGQSDVITPFCKTANDGLSVFRNGTPELFVIVPVSGIKTIIADHFVVMFRDVLDEQRNKIQRRDTFFDKSIVFMAMIMESNIFTIIRINAV